MFGCCFHGGEEGCLLLGSQVGVRYCFKIEGTANEHQKRKVGLNDGIRLQLGKKENVHSFHYFCLSWNGTRTLVHPSQLCILWWRASIPLPSILSIRIPGISKVSTKRSS
jgi:hypothetical protein